MHEKKLIKPKPRIFFRSQQLHFEVLSFLSQKLIEQRKYHQGRKELKNIMN